MNCSKADFYFMKYMDNSLSKDEEEKLNKHLEVCEQCRTDFQVYKSLFEEFSECTLIDAPEDFEANVMEKISKLPPAYAKADKLTNTLLTVFMVGICAALTLSVILFVNREQILTMMEGYPQLAGYVGSLTPVSGFMADLSKNIGAAAVDFAGTAAAFLNSAKYVILLAALALFGVQYLLYKKEKDKVEE